MNGASWRELCRDTSLDQGDVCRMLRRTVEVLRQVRRDKESEVQTSREMDIFVYIHANVDGHGHGHESMIE